MNTAVARHEARHAAAGLLLDVPIREAAISLDGGGYVTPNIDGLDPDLARRLALLVLVGRIGDPRWPPPSPPNKNATTGDERQLAALVPIIDGSWEGLCADALDLSAQPEFGRLEHALASLLEQGHVLDEHTLKHVHAIAIGADMQHKAVEAATVTTDQGEFTALASAYTVDRDNERIVPGAFAESIARWQASGKMVPLHWAHKGDAENITGSVDPATMHESDEGLRVEGKLDLDESEIARHAWRAMKRNTIGLSFGFLTKSARDSHDGVRELTELDLFEISLTPAPANPDTRIISMKSFDDEEEQDAPSHTEVHTRLVQEGIIARPAAEQATFEEARNHMLGVLSGNGGNPDDHGKALDDTEQRRRFAAATGDLKTHRKSTAPVQVAVFDA